jgi:hypothetical protein
MILTYPLSSSDTVFTTLEGRKQIMNIICFAISLYRVENFVTSLYIKNRITFLHYPNTVYSHCKTAV